MTALRLRVLKRHTSLEASFEDFFNAEMLARDGKPDHNLSVFDVEAVHLCRTHAEFVVSTLNPDPRRKRGGISLTNCSADFDATPNPAQGNLFSHSRDRHVELCFLRESEVRSFAKQIHDERADRDCSVSHADVVAYGKGRLAEGDAEWVNACREKPKWKKALGG